MYGGGSRDESIHDVITGRTGDGRCDRLLHFVKQRHLDAGSGQFIRFAHSVAIRIVPCVAFHLRELKERGIAFQDLPLSSVMIDRELDGRRFAIGRLGIIVERTVDNALVARTDLPLALRFSATGSFEIEMVFARQQRCSVDHKLAGRIRCDREQTKKLTVFQLDLPVRSVLARSISRRDDRSAVDLVPAFIVRRRLKQLLAVLVFKLHFRVRNPFFFSWIHDAIGVQVMPNASENVGRSRGRENSGIDIVDLVAVVKGEGLGPSGRGIVRLPRGGLRECPF